jgi:hypothetical protein
VAVSVQIVVFRVLSPCSFVVEGGKVARAHRYFYMCPLDYAK